jgi:hypothetical protein
MGVSKKGLFEGEIDFPAFLNEVKEGRRQDVVE